MNIESWLIRREFWENRAIWLIPAVFGALLIVAALFGHVGLPDLNSPIEHRDFNAIFLVVFGMMFYAVMSVYSTWYLLDCLYADRKDRSILFWKSLPISDTKTVLSKLVIALIVIPLVYFVAADLTALIVAIIFSIRVHSTIGGALWHVDLWLQMQILWLYATVVTAIWFLPLAGWLMAVSAWAKRAVILWSILPPLVLYIIERWFLGTNYIGRLIAHRLSGLPAVSLSPGGGHSWQAPDGSDHLKLPDSVFDFINPAYFFTRPETWIGAAVGVALIVVAIQLRMRRTEI
jgi:ABC-2 type transport system permease protein